MNFWFNYNFLFFNVDNYKENLNKDTISCQKLAQKK